MCNPWTFIPKASTALPQRRRIAEFAPSAMDASDVEAQVAASDAEAQGAFPDAGAQDVAEGRRDGPCPGGRAPPKARGRMRQSVA